MPRLFGVNPLGVVLAALVMVVIGFVWFVWLFPLANQLAFGWTQKDYIETNMSVQWRIVGFVLELLIAFGVAKVLKMTGTSGLVDSVKVSLILALFIAGPPVSYHLAYGPEHSVLGTIQVAGHLLVNFGVAGAILSKFE